MIGPDLAMLAELRAELRRLGGDVQTMIELRLQLASLELHVAIGQIKRLTTALAIAAAMGLTALPLVAVYMAEALDGRLGIARSTWLLLFAAGLLLLAGLVGWLAWRTFRRRFVGLEETLEELREDLLWFREWTSPAAEAVAAQQVASGPVTDTSDTRPRPGYRSVHSRRGRRGRGHE